ncbi:hypothetical protein DL89DRAFT_119075 [Linderina pennispora]|uniref:Uncharacterized protein n=1 Tax=Linderina pennispora TaxID=61395 RepID=A0A1Y1VVG0_9FUNG|nr:uncharacterized protein DL89DRAFT_119075 [Linderina pennispora]ORX65279.1 hypothetical protein DL89DRAFT_119075 [Linderina pennispora]
MYFDGWFTSNYFIGHSRSSRLTQTKQNCSRIHASAYLSSFNLLVHLSIQAAKREYFILPTKSWSCLYDHPYRLVGGVDKRTLACSSGGFELTCGANISGKHCSPHSSGNANFAVFLCRNTGSDSAFSDQLYCICYLLLPFLLRSAHLSATQRFISTCI